MMVPVASVVLIVQVMFDMNGAVNQFLLRFGAHYYGGVKKYQWVTIPLALHGVIVKKDGIFGVHSSVNNLISLNFSSVVILDVLRATKRYISAKSSLGSLPLIK